MSQFDVETFIFRVNVRYVSGSYYKYDGLSTVNYDLLETNLEALFTRFLVRIDGPNNENDVQKFFEKSLRNLQKLKIRDMLNAFESMRP